MKVQLIVPFCLIFSFIFLKSTATPDTQWAVIGAGPAGIAVIGVLTDSGVKPYEITWIDPEFNVGRLGKYYSSVPANIKTKCFWRFIKSCDIFGEIQTPSIYALFNEYNPKKEYPLSNIVEPLRDITRYLRTKMQSKQTMLTSLNFDNELWHVGLENEKLTAAHVVLATGSQPRVLNYCECKNCIPLDLALDNNKLARLVEPDDTIAVVGSSHSAILLLKFLSELQVARIINFYKHPLIYDKDEIGLMGITAWWAKNVLEVNPPANLLRIFNSDETRKAWLPLCTKIIYAMGYERDSLPVINECEYIHYDDQTGIIGPRLFGIGIAFPETFMCQETGKKVARVGLMGFMDYAKRVVPLWMNQNDVISKPTITDEAKRSIVNCSKEKQAMIVNNY